MDLLPLSIVATDLPNGARVAVRLTADGPIRTGTVTGHGPLANGLFIRPDCDPTDEWHVPYTAVLAAAVD